MVDSLSETENCGKFQPELGLVCGIPYQHEVVSVAFFEPFPHTREIAGQQYENEGEERERREYHH